MIERDSSNSRSNLRSSHREPWFKDISDRSRYPNINIYLSRLIKNGTAICLPGIGIIVSISYQGIELEKVVQHEYGHLLDAHHGIILSKKMPTLFKYLLFYMIIGVPSLLSAAAGKRGAHRYFWTEIRANKLAKDFFGSGYVGDEQNYPQSEL